MRNTFSKKCVIPGVMVLFVTFTSMVSSHCQIPCGIYNDPARFDSIAEHITTIEKSMQQITEMSKQDKPDMNQIVRWVANKDTHADALSEIVTYYFMAQRVKPVDKNQGKAYKEYVKKLTLLHEMLVHSMKAKQTTDLSNVEKLRSLSVEFKEIYFGKHNHKH
jgi:nickel superoxide dismutase